MKRYPPTIQARAVWRVLPVSVALVFVGVPLGGGASHIRNKKESVTTLSVYLPSVVSDLV